MAAELSSEATRARKALAEAVDVHAGTYLWYTRQATVAMKKLLDRWQLLCSEAGDALSDKDVKECRELLADCGVLRSMIAEETGKCADGANVRLQLVNTLAPNDSDLTKSVEAFCEGWNQRIQPEVVRLYESLERLEKSIESTIGAVAQEELS